MAGSQLSLAPILYNERVMNLRIHLGKPHVGIGYFGIYFLLSECKVQVDNIWMILLWGIVTIYYWVSALAMGPVIWAFAERLDRIKKGKIFEGDVNSVVLNYGEVEREEVPPLSNLSFCSSDESENWFRAMFFVLMMFGALILKSWLFTLAIFSLEFNRFVVRILTTEIGNLQKGN